MFKNSITGLDRLFEEGDIPDGSVILVTGIEGALKSSFIFNMISNYIAGTDEHGLYASLEETKENHLRNMESLGIKKSDNLHIFDYKDMRFESKNEELDIVKVTEDMIDFYREKYDNLTVFALDSLNAFYSVSTGVSLRKNMYHFFTMLRDKDLTSFLIMETCSPAKYVFVIHSVISNCASINILCFVYRKARYIMKKLEIEYAEIMKVAIQQEIFRSEESRYDHRLHGVLLVCQGLTCPQVSKILGDSPRIIEYWVKDFNEKGFDGLHEEKRSGRPPVIDEKTLSFIDCDLRQNPSSFGYTQNLWDGKMLSHHLKEKYDIELGIRQCQRLFNKLDFRLRKPRPVIAKSDDRAKAEYKKN